jgi:hypothetical protein
VKTAINLIREMVDPRLTNSEEAAVLLNLVRMLNAPQTEASKNNTYEAWLQAQLNLAN